MNLWNALRGLSGKLYLLCTALAIALAAVAAFAYVQLDGVIESANRTKTVRAPQLAMMAQVELNVTRMSLQLRHAMLARTPQERNAALEDIAAKKAGIDTLLADYERSLYTPEGRKRFAQVPPAMAGFLKTAGENLEAVKGGDMQKAFAFLVERTIPSRNALLDPSRTT